MKNLSATLHEKQKMEGGFNEHKNDYFDFCNTLSEILTILGGAMRVA